MWMVSQARSIDGVELILGELTVGELIHIILVHPGPPHIAPGKWFNPTYSWMTLLQHLQCLFPSLWWNNNPALPQHTPPLNP